MYLSQGRVRDLIAQFLKARAPQDSSVSAAMKSTYLEWLPYIDTRQQHNEARSHRRSKTTGGWFLDGEPFQKFSNAAQGGDGRSTLMWLHAKAGAGKTVLTSTIIDHIERQKLGPLAFFYFSFQGKDRSSRTLDVWHFKSTLLVQILKAIIVPDPLDRSFFLVPAVFRRLYSKYSPSRNPTMEDLDSAIWKLLTAYQSSVLSKKTQQPFYFVVDGLDEYPGIPGRREIVDFLGDMLAKFPFNIHALVTSRLEPDISAAIAVISPPAPALVFALAFDKETINADINRHLSHLIKSGSDTSFDSWSEDLKEEVINQLTEQAEGVFRWADLQVKALAGKEREKDVRKALKRLPKGLEETYERMLRRIEDADNSEEAMTVLSWLVCARRSLSLAEVAELVAFDFKNGDDDSSTSNGSAGEEDAFDGDSPVTFDPSARYKNSDSLKRILAGLVTFTESRQFLLWDRQDRLDQSLENRTLVTFAHFSVKQYLQSRDLVPARFRLDPVECNRLVFRCCLAYMEHYDDIIAKGGSNMLTSSRAPYPLLLYTWQHTWAHALEGHIADSNRGRHTKQGTTGAADLIDEHSRKQPVAFSLTLSVRYAIWRANTAFCEKPKDQKLLISLIKKVSGLDSIVEDSTNGSCPWAIVFPCLDLLDNNRRAVAFAIAALAEPSLMQLILDVGVNAVMMDDPISQKTLLHALSSGGQYLESILKPVPAIDQHLRNVPKTANGSLVAETMQKLIAGGCSLEARDREGRVALHSAASAGQTSTLKDLLAHHTTADVEQMDRNGGIGVTPHERRDSLGRTPFFLAVSRGHLETCKMLLESMEHPARDMNISDRRGRTPLIEAAAMQRTALIPFFLSRPEVNVNQRDKRGRTALLWAMWRGEKQAVDLLLAHSLVEKDTVDAEGWNMLICAAESGHDELVRHLVLQPDRTDINHLDIHGRTALSWAAFRGHKSVVEILITQPHIRIDTRDHLGCSPLDWAKFRGHDEVAELLINYPKHVSDPKRPTTFSTDTGRALGSPLESSKWIGKMDIQLKLTLSFPAAMSWSEEVWCTDFSHDGRRLAVGGRASFVDIWDMTSFKLESTLETPDHVGVVSWSPDDFMLVTCTLSGALIWEAENATCVRVVRLDSSDGFDVPITSCIWSPDGGWVVLGSHHPERSLWKEVLVTDNDEAKMTSSTTTAVKDMWYVDMFPHVEEMGLWADGKTIVIADHEGTIYWVKVDRPSWGHLQLHSRIAGICLSHDSLKVLLALTSGELALVDLGRPRSADNIGAEYTGAKGGEFKQRCSFGGGVRGEDFVLSGSEDGSILIWDKKTTELLVRLASQHPPRCNTVAWSPTDPSLFVSGGDDPTWKIWQVTNLEPLATAVSGGQGPEHHKHELADLADIEQL